MEIIIEQRNQVRPNNANHRQTSIGTGIQGISIRSTITPTIQKAFHETCIHPKYTSNNS